MGKQTIRVISVTYSISAMSIIAPKGKAMTQGELLNNMVNLTGLKRKEARLAMATFKSIGSFEMKKRGVFVLPGFAKFTVKSLPAKPAREGINPFTKEPCVFKAKPARKIVKARVTKHLKN